MRHHRWGDDPRDPHPCEDCPWWSPGRACDCAEADYARDNNIFDE